MPDADKNDKSEVTEPTPTPPPPANANVPAAFTPAPNPADPQLTVEQEQRIKLQEKVDAVLEGRRTGDTVEKTQARLLKNLEKLDGEAYWANMWGDKVKLQCKYCPWDAVDETDTKFPLESAIRRMLEHVLASGESTHSGEPVYDRYGRYIG